MKLIYNELPGDNKSFGSRISGATIFQGELVQPGDNAFTFRGEPCVVNHFARPHKSSSEGKITVQVEGERGSAEFYVSVIGAQWINREDRN